MDMKSSNTRNWEGVDGDDTWGATSSPPTQLGQAAGKFCLNGLGTPLEHIKLVGTGQAQVGQLLLGTMQAGLLTEPLRFAI